MTYSCTFRDSSPLPTPVSQQNSHQERKSLLVSICERVTSFILKIFDFLSRLFCCKDRNQQDKPPTDEHLHALFNARDAEALNKFSRNEQIRQFNAKMHIANHRNLTINEILSNLREDQRQEYGSYLRYVYNHRFELLSDLFQE